MRAVLGDPIRFSRPFGTWARLNSGPNVETLGYFQLSLRDENRSVWSFSSASGDTAVRLLAARPRPLAEEPGILRGGLMLEHIHLLRLTMRIATSNLAAGLLVRSPPAMLAGPPDVTFVEHYAAAEPIQTV
jgi:hypothetical protein